MSRSRRKTHPSDTRFLASLFGILGLLLLVIWVLTGRGSTLVFAGLCFIFAALCVYRPQRSDRSR